jgi:hypothetical protein
MSEDLNKQIAELANKLGVSLDHLWGVLIRQAYIDGISSLATQDSKGVPIAADNSKYKIAFDHSFLPGVCRLKQMTF